LSSEGVLIFPVKSNHAPHRASHRAPLSSSCSPQGLATVKSGHSRFRIRTGLRLGNGLRLASSRLLAILLLIAAAAAAMAQSLTIEQIRVIGQRRIPKETIVARLFTHVGDTYDPVSIERDFNSLWNTGYFEDLRIEREDSEKGVILNVYVKEKPNIREINYKGLNSVSTSDVLDRFKKEKVVAVAGEPVRSDQDQAR
jgi:outer membrane protein insertion porin family